MIDLHCHILPGVDDGPQTLEESLEMGRLYVQAGFSRVVTTPHWVGGSVWMPQPERINQAVLALNAALAKHNISLEVLPGMEIAMDSGLAGLFDQGRLLGIAGTDYVLVEPPFQQMPMGWEQVFFALMSRGWRILLAHPERCAQLGAHPEMVREIVASGVYLQVNYDSLLGNYGKAVEEAAWRLVRRGLVHCLATDSHDPVRRHLGGAAEALQMLRDTVGARAADLMARENPARVLAGEGLVVPEVENNRVKKKKGIPFKWLRFMG